MASDEEATDPELAARARGGCPHALDSLVQRHTPLVARIIDRLKLPSEVDRDDVRQEGLLALARAAVKWVPGHGSHSKLTTYAWMAVRNGVADEVRYQLKAAIRAASDEEGCVLDAIPARSDTPTNSDVAEVVEVALAGLPRPMREAIRLAHGLDGEVPLRRRELAVRLGLSQTQTKRVIAAARERLRTSIRRRPVARPVSFG